MKTIIAFMSLAIFSFACFGQSQDKIEWGEKYNTSGATLVLKEFGRTPAKGQTVVTYNLYATGLPKDVEYTLWTRLAGEQPQATADAFINKDGLVVNVLADPAKGTDEDPINLKILAGRGEPKLFALISNDDHYRVFGQATPFPIESTSGPCRISATMMSRNYSGVFVVVTGLQPKEEFQVVQKSGNEGGQTKVTAEADGTYRTLVFPAVKGQASGKLQFTVTAKSCAVGLEVPWGQGSYVVQ